ncbi:nitrate reductase molybdenum cofactor assembly chaperone [Streptomyces sp. NPDC101225]|uniref:nitrate reductase molybdenum cofactor assembly chaperone n=1 Tax=Streptomyces sp. NPDC101225 TaxID=3366135 RepID=UPI00382A3BEF
MNQHRAVHQAASLLLSYPDQRWPAHRALVLESIGGLSGPATESLRRFCRRTADVPLLDLAAQYVTTFDRSRRRTLHLTHYAAGDPRRRGASLAALEDRYRHYGWEPTGGEPPDHLPAVLEFAARCPAAGHAVLHEHRGALALLAAGLAAEGSPYLDVIRAVRATLGEGARP